MGEYKHTCFKVKRAGLDEKAILAPLGFVPFNKLLLTASYEASYLMLPYPKIFVGKSRFARFIL